MSRRHARMPSRNWKRTAVYGVALALAAIGLQWLDYQRLARTHWDDFYIGLIALAFLALGVFVGARLFAGRHRPPAFDGNPRAQDSLGISDRERAVLLELAAGRSNKEIARELHIAPSTVKTHVARLYEKLGARRRTEAVRRARELGLVP
ncbi:response regulator transcription factor [Pseudoxanthomonas sp. 22568]|uniref:helix-turn-helix transcriptional regulator n=2 Tax=Pseudoxanthomonas TaxID=83618 RepID=UPI00193B30DE|nr:response regulator transcription factor [Pseudoxanthomonas beigongshangi]